MSDERTCKTCAHSGAWGPWYPKTFTICRSPQAIKIYGGPRSTEDIVRKGACKDGGLWQTARRKEADQGVIEQ